VESMQPACCLPFDDRPGRMAESDQLAHRSNPVLSGRQVLQRPI
jgi:hypothetical protein